MREMVQGSVESELRERPGELTPRFTFQNFVVGGSNRLAHASALSVAERPGGHYNPLFIFSDGGLGKTHLMLAIARVADSRGENVVYLTGDQFTNEVSDNLKELRSKLKNTSYLLIDDLQFVVGEEAQGELVHIFDDLISSNHQIVVSSDLHPRSIPLLPPQLKSYFDEGLVVSIGVPEPELYVAILGEKAKERGLNLSPDVFDLIVKRTVVGIRQMEGFLNIVVAFGKAHCRPITFEMAVEALSEFEETRTRRLAARVDDIIPVVAKVMKVTEEQIRGSKRDRPIALARHVAMWLMREETPLSLVEIGWECGRRDHSTVVHACARIEEELKVNLRFARRVAEIRKELFSL